MTTMIAEFLKEACATEGKASASAAAKSIADYENHFVLIESKIDRFKTALESEIKIVKTEFSVIKWFLGF